jgi:ElaB/YqjD/DUF883 family membrane-anchored ribosome-binding protein
MGKTTDELGVGYGEPDPADAPYTEDAPLTDSYLEVDRTSRIVTAADYTSPDLGSYSAPSTTETPEPDPVEDAKSQIEQTRAEMSQTIDAIQERLAPSNLAQQAKHAVRDATVGKAQDMVENAGDSARGFGSGIVETIKQNPIPAALAGVGIGWLIMSGRKNTTHDTVRGYSPGYRYDTRSGYQGYGTDYRTYPADYDYSRQGSGVGGRIQQASNAASTVAGQAQNVAGQAVGTVQETAGQVASQVQGTAGQVVGQFQDTAGQVAGQVQETAGQVVGQVQDTAGHLAYQAQYGAQRAQGSLQQMLQDNPLAVGAGALALGLAIGLAVPETSKENELMGSARDQLIDQAQSTVQEKAQQVQQVAQQAVGAAKDAAQQAANDQGLTS